MIPRIFSITKRGNMLNTSNTLRAVSAILLLAVVSMSQVVTPNPLSPLKNKKVMVLTGGGQGSHGPARDATLNNLKAMATDVGFTLSIGDPLNLTDASLASIDILVFNFFFQTDVETIFPTKSKNAFIAWLKKGNKGYIGYHTSGANEYAKQEWLWYQENVTSMYYALHGNDIPQGTVGKTTDAAILSHPIMQGLPATFTAVDEWYEYDKDSPLLAPSSGCKVMYYLSNAQALNRAPYPVHPVAWFREDAAHTRYFYSTFAHNIDAVNTTWFKGIILRALEYVSGDPTTPIMKNNGAPVASFKNLSYIASSKELSVDLDGAYSISVYSQNGKLLYKNHGLGKSTFAPPAFNQSGLYTVRVSTKLKKYSQRILIH